MRTIPFASIERLVLLMIFLGAADACRADVMQQLSSRAGLADTIGWSQLGSGHVGNGAMVVSTGGVSATATGAATGFFVGQQGINWFGDFANGDIILDTGDNISSTYGPMTITFPTPISAFGTQMEVDAFGAYSGTITAYNAANSPLAVYPFSSTSHGNGDNSAVFIGLADLTGPDIATVVIRDNATTGSAANFAINELSLTGAVPEPASAGLMAVAGAWLFFWRLRPGKIKRN